MTERIYLIGAEQVDSAGHRMASAAQEMRQAAASIDMTLHAHRNFMNDWLAHFEQVMKQAHDLRMEEIREERINHSQFGVGA
jgi:hypothetical protein